MSPLGGRLLISWWLLESRVAQAPHLLPSVIDSLECCFALVAAKTAASFHKVHLKVAKMTLTSCCVSNARVRLFCPTDPGL